MTWDYADRLTSASVGGSYTYDVFGAFRSETGRQANDYRFTGQQLPQTHD